MATKPPKKASIDTALIKKRREQLDLTMDQAAAMAGIGQRMHWFRIESGRVPRPSIDTASRIAQVLRLWIDDLITKAELPSAGKTLSGAHRASRHVG